jgi:hypothetical protein
LILIGTRRKPRDEIPFLSADWIGHLVDSPLGTSWLRSLQSLHHL